MIEHNVVLVEKGSTNQTKASACLSGVRTKGLQPRNAKIARACEGVSNRKDQLENCCVPLPHAGFAGPVKGRPFMNSPRILAVPLPICICRSGSTELHGMIMVQLKPPS